MGERAAERSGSPVAAVLEAREALSARAATSLSHSPWGFVDVDDGLAEPARPLRLSARASACVACSDRGTGSLK